jgi:hypothetical protein
VLDESQTREEDRYEEREKVYRKKGAVIKCQNFTTLMSLNISPLSVYLMHKQGYYEMYIFKKNEEATKRTPPPQLNLSLIL